MNFSGNLPIHIATPIRPFTSSFQPMDNSLLNLNNQQAASLYLRNLSFLQQNTQPTLNLASLSELARLPQPMSVPRDMNQKPQLLSLGNRIVFSQNVPRFQPVIFVSPLQQQGCMVEQPAAKTSPIIPKLNTENIILQAAQNSKNEDNNVHSDSKSDTMTEASLSMKVKKTSSTKKVKKVNSPAASENSTEDKSENSSFETDFEHIEVPKVSSKRIEKTRYQLDNYNRMVLQDKVLSEEELNNLIQDLELELKKTLQLEDIEADKIIKTLKKNNMNVREAMKSIKKNLAFYKKYFSNPAKKIEQ